MSSQENECPGCKGLGGSRAYRRGKLEAEQCAMCNGTGLKKGSKALSTSTSSGIEADTKPSSTLEENIEKTLEAFRRVCVNKEAGPGFEQTTQALLSLYQKELVRATARLRANLAGAMGHMEGCGHTYEYLIKNYPELQGELTGEQP